MKESLYTFLISSSGFIDFNYMDGRLKQKLKLKKPTALKLL